MFLALLAISLVFSPASRAQSASPDWQAQVRRYAKAKDWNSALRLVEQQIARAPQDTDVRAWRARLLAWSGKPPEAEKGYLEVLKVSPTDPDNWIGLADVYLREGKLADAQRAISTAGRTRSEAVRHSPSTDPVSGRAKKRSAIRVSVCAALGSGEHRSAKD